MITVKSSDSLESLINESKAVLVLFGGENCGVCQAIKPKLRRQLNSTFPELELVYADCQLYPEVCAQSAVFSLPVVRVYFEGQLFCEEIKAFSLSKLVKDIERPYKTLFDAN